MTAAEAVVLVHGLWMSTAVMAIMQRRIAAYGYHAVCCPYPSMQASLAENAARLGAFCQTLDAPKLNFIGHSLGGLVILSLLERTPPPRAGRIVLCGSPVGGSHAARAFAKLPGGRRALGKSIVEWHLSARSAALRAYEIGVIAGSLGIGLGRVIAPDLPQPNDGVVAVAETRLPDMRDSIVLDVNHFGMLLSREVVQAACTFIKHGRFHNVEKRA